VISFRILGPVAVLEDGEPKPLRAAKPRALLALLLVNANRSVPSERIVDELWPDDPPETAAKAVQTYISQLRHLVGEARLKHEGRGYRLAVGAGELDSERFKELLAAASAQSDQDARLEQLTQAVALWTGDALEDVAAPFAATEAAHLEELRLEAVEGRLECELALGRAVAPAELERLATAHPERERIVELAMLALYRSGRQADALALYRTVRARLVDELGLEPSRTLRDLEQAMLRGDRSLEKPRPAVAAPAPGTRPRWPLYAGAVALAVVVAAIVVAVVGNGGHTPKPKPPPRTSAALQSFVVKLENLIAQSNDGRKQVVAIVGAAAACKLPARQGLFRLAAVEQNRQSLLDQLAALTVPRGRSPLLVTQRFQRAIQLSIASDFGYRAWLQGLGKPCRPARAAAALRAVATDSRVSAAKAAFVAAFDPLARRFHRRTWTADDV
jgi:DNA-binding SARP family transcriptional activator